MLLIDLNTGSGKTYRSCQIIYDYILKQNGSKKIYFTTTLLKNLPEEELRKTYDNNNDKNYAKEVLVIKSNEDFVKENLPKAKISEEYQGDEYKSLYNLV